MNPDTEPAEPNWDEKPVVYPLYPFDKVVTVTVRHTGGPVAVGITLDEQTSGSLIDGETSVVDGVMTFHPETFPGGLCVVALAFVNRLGGRRRSRYRVEVAGLNRLLPGIDDRVHPDSAAWEGEIRPGWGLKLLLGLAVFPRSGEQVLHDPAVNVGEAEVPPGVTVRELLVVEA
jgi:hypothetical protein